MSSSQKTRGETVFLTVVMPVPRPDMGILRLRFGSIHAPVRPAFLWRIGRNSQVVHRSARGAYFDPVVTSPPTSAFSRKCVLCVFVERKLSSVFSEISELFVWRFRWSPEIHGRLRITRHGVSTIGDVLVKGGRLDGLSKRRLGLFWLNRKAVSAQRTMLTGVPGGAFSKNFSAAAWGRRMQPWEAA